MDENKNVRLMVLFGAIICNMTAGFFYSWSVYVGPLVQKNDWNIGDTGLAFSIATCMIPLAMIGASKVTLKIGATKMVLLGGLSLVLGLIVSGFATHIMILYLGYGILGGIGVGVIYGTTNATCVKWFPDKKGTVSGMVVAGFGSGSVLFSPICTKIIGPLGPSYTLFVQATITMIIIAMGAPLLKIAADEYKPEGWSPSVVSGSIDDSHNYTSREMIKVPQYWFLLIMYLFANMSGLFIIGNVSPISQEIAGLTPVKAGLIVSILSITNTVGRFIGGAATDRFGAERVIAVIYIINTVLLLSLSFMHNFLLIALSISGLAICFGAMMGSYPSIVIDYFGGKHFSSNYAFVFLAYSIGGLLAGFIVNTSIVSTGSYHLAFMIIGGSCVIGAIMALFAKKPIYKG